MLVGLWTAAWLGGGDRDAAARDAKVAQLEQRLGELGKAPPPGVTSQQLDDLAARLGKLETAAPKPAADTDLTGRIAAAEDQTKSLTDQVATLGRHVADTDQRISAAEANPSVDAPDAQAAISALSGRVAALETGARTIEDELAAPPRLNSDDRSARAAVVAVALADAIVRGRPLGPELLAAAKSLAPDPAVLAPLDPFVSSGVPTAVSLGRELSALEPALLQAGAAPPPDRSLLDKLGDNARALVRIRPIGEVAGAEPEAAIARAEVKSARGDLPGAVAELSALPADMRAPAQGWIAKAQGRVAAIEAGRRFASDTLAALANPSPP